MPADELYNPAQSPHSDVDSDDDLDRPAPSRQRGGKKAKGKGKGKDMNAWEGALKRSWDVVREDDHGGLQAAVDSFIARGRRKR